MLHTLALQTHLPAAAGSSGDQLNIFLAQAHYTGGMKGRTWLEKDSRGQSRQGP
jgi:hypothetical protein